ncbi:hypothetical protein BH23PLA1_BH23PLA1_14980 [soil metagenome]
MPTLMEARVARARKIPYKETRLASAASDFYLLEALANIEGVAKAKPKLAALESKLAKEFSDYLDIAIGGELRYAQSMLGDAVPNELAPYFKEVQTYRRDRGTAWLIWGVIRRKLGSRALELAELTFEQPGWRSSFGGYPWAGITRVLRSYLEGRINDRIFVDRCWSLQHNSGCALNKLYSVRDLAEVLEAHGNDNYPILVRNASAEVRNIWETHRRQKRRAIWLDHDPAWLGICAWEPELAPTGAWL